MRRRIVWLLALLVSLFALIGGGQKSVALVKQNRAMRYHDRMRYAHTNIITNDWKRLAQFYCDVFACTPMPPERNQSGAWLDRGTGLTDAHLKGIHLRLPGHGDEGPTLEIYQYQQVLSNSIAKPNRQGLGHLAFEVEDVQATRDKVLEHGGAELGTLSQTPVEGVGMLTFVYLADPDGNILEIQRWN